MKQIIDIFMLAGEEISYLSSSTKIIFIIFGLISSIISIKQTYKSYKDIKSMYKADRERKKRWEYILQQAEHRAQGINTNPTEDINHHKIKFK